MSPTAAAAAIAASPAARIAGIRSRFEQPGSATTPTTSASDFSSLLTSMLGADATGGLGTSTIATLLGALGASGATGAAATGQAGGSGSGGDQVVDAAKQYLGVPYRWGGTDPATGLDCSGFVQQAYSDVGVDLPRVSRDQAKVGTPVASIADARPGDLVAFGEPVDHIAIYIGDGQIIHAPHTGDVVKIAPLHRTPTAIRRVLPDGASGAIGASGGVGRSGGVGSTSGAATGAVPADLRSIIASTPKLAQYSNLFVQAGQRYGVSPAVLAAVARQESGGNANAVSSAGASGLMQFMPGTAKSLGIDPLDPAQAVDGAARYLSQQLQSFGSLELALAAYNAGPGAVRRYGGIPPYGETQNYVRKITSSLTAAGSAIGAAS